MWKWKSNLNGTGKHEPKAVYLRLIFSVMNNLNNWMWEEGEIFFVGSLQWLRLDSSKGPNRESVSSSNDGNRSSFRNFVFSSYLESLTIDKVLELCDFLI
jgi:hypothetical protein